ncbi:helix-turn-helix domain-containing protein [Haemophilus haemolyticus]|jgi:DNA binding domain, excisionase family|uniref:DNA-binding protein n=2 Tax=Haemophilus TaxID=724 RepID=A0A502J4U4_HAEHA|nr:MULTISPECIES: helix-turn-helix domain-containing protein [Haemophilus]EGT81167.1 putative dNA binding domain, putative [Haemophilus haemolyticus M21639]NYA26230.1 helix-turn-helix domain-containing protein [Haemophilus haemolyticus]NYA48515.1 helix-turn-helix domain-containing protein [Haemophilus haemolyticus]OEY76861.1 DNA-binding protein [Haemophilus quentini]OEY77731.1 DNA-binding protein [Haemophilus quentini]
MSELITSEFDGIEKHYNVREIKKILGISRSTLDRMAKNGKLTKIKMGRTTLYPESSLKACLKLAK